MTTKGIKRHVQFRKYAHFLFSYLHFSTEPLFHFWIKRYQFFFFPPFAVMRWKKTTGKQKPSRFLKRKNNSLEIGFYALSLLVHYGFIQRRPGTNTGVWLPQCSQRLALITWTTKPCACHHVPVSLRCKTHTWPYAFGVFSARTFTWPNVILAQSFDVFYISPVNRAQARQQWGVSLRDGGKGA